jgi:hypothetical protein
MPEFGKSTGKDQIPAVVLRSGVGVISVLVVSLTSRVKATKFRPPIYGVRAKLATPRDFRSGYAAAVAEGEMKPLRVCQRDCFRYTRNACRF